MAKPLSSNGNLKGYWTVSEAARFVGVNPMTLRRWDKAKKLRAYRHPMNSYRLYKKVELETLLKKIKASVHRSPRKSEKRLRK